LGVGHLEISTSRKIGYKARRLRYGLQDVGFYCCDTAAAEGKSHTHATKGPFEISQRRNEEPTRLTAWKP